MANGQYHGTVPNIAQAYQNDPRTKLAANALAQGTSTAPVAGGAWAWADGLSRVGQAFLAKHMTDKQDKKYSAREDEYMAGLRDAAATAGGQNPAAVNPATMNPAQANPAAPPMGQTPTGMDAAASALGGRVNVPQPGQVQPVELPPSMPAQQAQGAPPMMGGGAPPPMPQMASAVPTQRPAQPMMPNMVEGGSAPMPPNPTTGGTGPSRGAVRPQAPSPSMYFRKGIVPIEGGTDKNGKFLTSPKGAYGPSQLMPGTAPEALALAGFDRNDPRWRTDPQVNLKAGEAYYAKQLQTFGDPIKAAAAYNAGPGNVRRALRRASSRGGDWTQYLPDETKKYIVNFQNKVGGATGGAEGVPQSPVDVPQMQMEQVPGLPEAPPQQMPSAPQRPQEVQTQRIAMAQQLLQSGNPDLAAMAQSYLDKGLDEQQNARTLASQQEFQQGQTGYQAGLNDWGDARSADRGFRYNDVRDTKQRNFQREAQNVEMEYGINNREDQQAYGTAEREAGQVYGTTERQAQQGYQAAERNADRLFNRSERLGGELFQAEQNDLTRGNKLDIAGQKRAQYFGTEAGAKKLDEVESEINKNLGLIERYERFMQINKDQETGGVALNTPILGDMYAWTDSELREMNKIAKDATFKDLGGLGAQISDGDRKFVEDSNVNTSTKGPENANIALARIGVLRRNIDYKTEYLNSMAQGTQQQFVREWSQFAQSAPIVQYDANGRAIATDKPLTFQQWKSRKRYNAKGEVVR